MNKNQLAKAGSNGRVKLFLTLHDAALLLIILYISMKLSFTTNLEDLDDAIMRQEEDIKMFAKGKRLSKKEMADGVIKYAMRAYLQAKNLGLTEIAASLQKQVYYISGAPAKVAEARAKELVKIMDDNKAQLTVITVAIVAEMTGLVENFSAIMDMPKSEIERRKAEGTARIDAVQLKIDENKADFRELIISYLPDLLDDYDAAARIGAGEGVKHISLSVHVVDAVGGMPLRKVVVTITNGEKIVKVKTGKGGNARFLGLESGLWNVLVERTGYPDYKQDEVAVDNTKAMKLEVQLKKKTLPDKKLGGFALTVYEKDTGKKLAGLILFLPAVNKSYTSDDDGLFKGVDLEVGAYVAVVSGEAIVTKNISIVIDGGKETVGSFWVVKS